MSDESGLAGRRVLIVEDTEDSRRLLRFVLQFADAEVLEAADAETGIEIARREVPDLIVMDVHMPGIDGLSAVRYLRADEITHDITIVVVSASAMKSDEEKARAAGCDGFMPKPIDSLTFARDIAQYLRPKN